MEEIKKRNDKIQTLFYDYLNTKDDDKLVKLKELIKEWHNYQWSPNVYNILDCKTNCANDCKYCYMKRLKNKFFDVDIENLDMEIEDKKVNKKWRSNETKLIMFPSSHDIFPEFIKAYTKTCINILDAGHQLLIVSKPRLECIEYLIKHLTNYKDNIIFRLTITTHDEDTLKYWEHNASNFDERVKCLKLLYKNGFKTSISLEPFLENPTYIITKLDKYITNDIWIGVMSGMETIDIDKDEKNRLLKLYDKNNLLKLIKKFKDNKKVYWKTSIMKIIIKN